MGTSAMAVIRKVDAQTIGRLFVESVRDLGFVRSVHVRETRDWLEVWVVTDPIEPDDERPLFEAGVRMWGRFPEAGVLVQVVNPLDYPEGHNLVRDVVPAQAEAVAASR